MDITRRDAIKLGLGSAALPLLPGTHALPAEFTTGYPHIDHAIGGFHRGQIFAILEVGKHLIQASGSYCYDADLRLFWDMVVDNLRIGKKVLTVRNFWDANYMRYDRTHDEYYTNRLPGRTLAHHEIAFHNPPPRADAKLPSVIRQLHVAHTKLDTAVVAMVKLYKPDLIFWIQSISSPLVVDTKFLREQFAQKGIGVVIQSFGFIGTSPLLIADHVWNLLGPESRVVSVIKRPNGKPPCAFLLDRFNFAPTRSDCS